MKDEPLIGQVCVSCRPGMPTLTAEEIAEYMPQTPGWTVTDDGKSIRREFKFKGKTAFKDAEAFILDLGPKVGLIAEQEGHHPDIAYGWGYVRITLTTHAIHGLSKNDFILAAKVNALLP